jgi:hypothetical protein
MCGSLLIGLSTIVSVVILIPSECDKPIVGCLLIKVLSQIYKLTFLTIAPQIFLIFILSLLIIKIHGFLYLKRIIANLFFLSCLNIFPLVIIVYLANYTEVAYEKIIIATSLLCPLISHFITDLAMKLLEENRAN